MCVTRPRTYSRFQMDVSCGQEKQYGAVRQRLARQAHARLAAGGGPSTGVGRWVGSQPELAAKGASSLAGNGRDSGCPAPSRPGVADQSAAFHRPASSPSGCYAGRTRTTVAGERSHRWPLGTATRASTPKKSLQASEQDPRASRRCGRLGGKHAVLWTRESSSLSMKAASLLP